MRTSPIFTTEKTPARLATGAKELFHVASKQQHDAAQ